MSLALQPVERSSLSDAVFDQLANRILGRQVRPGEPLPSERDLVKLLGVNRGAIREALKRLSQAGLVEQRHGGNTIVLDFRRTGSLALLGQLLVDAHGSPNLEVARSIMEMRAALAPDIARLAAERAEPELIAAVGECVAAMREVLASERSEEAKLDALQVLSLEFWDHLVSGSRNIAYRLAFNTLRNTYESIREALILPLAEELRQTDDYARIVAALHVRDGRLARACAEAIVARGSEGVMTGIELFEELDSAERARGA